MKKILVSLAAALFGFAAMPSQAADTATNNVGEAGVYLWDVQSELDEHDVENDYAVGFYAAFNTPTPMTPNFKLRYNSFSDANDKLKVIDLLAYGAVLNNGVVSINAGLGASSFDGKLYDDEYGEWVADFYLNGEIMVPTTNMTLYMEWVRGTDFGFDTSTSDLQFGAKFALVTQPTTINLFAGYRMIDNDYDDFGYSGGGNYTQNGFIFGVSAGF